MAGPDGIAQRRLSWRAALESRPWAHDFYQVLRRVEALHPEAPRLGEARRPTDEPVRLGQQAELTFAPANVAAVESGPGDRPRILVRFLGFWGPQGPLPLHLTEFARERARSYDDPTLVRFADMFHHRLLLLFYRAWRQAQPTANRDRPDGDRYRTYVGALSGHGMPAWQGRDALPDDARRHFAGVLSRSVRHADGLADILAAYLLVPVAVESFVPRWMRLPPDQRTCLGARSASAQLGIGAVSGERVFDAQHHCRLRIGPMPLQDYEQLLPPGAWHPKLRDWVREYIGEELFVRARLVLQEAQAPAARLGGRGRLGWSLWLGAPPAAGPVDGVELELSGAPA